MSLMTVVWLHTPSSIIALLKQRKICVGYAVVASVQYNKLTRSAQFRLPCIGAFVPLPLWRTLVVLSPCRYYQRLRTAGPIDRQTPDNPLAPSISLFLWSYPANTQTRTFLYQNNRITTRGAACLFSFNRREIVSVEPRAIRFLLEYRLVIVLISIIFNEKMLFYLVRAR